jgi:hypothetical protein
MVYRAGAAAKYSLQMSYPQNLGNKGLTGVFGLFSPFMYRIAIRGNEGLCVFHRISSSFFPRKDMRLPVALRFSRRRSWAARDGFRAYFFLFRLCAEGA